VNTRIDLRRFFIYFALMLLAMVLCYFFIDRVLVLWVYEHQFNKLHLLHKFFRVPELFMYAIPLIFIYFGIRFSYKEETYFDWFLLSMAASFTVAFFFKMGLKYVLGRESVTLFLRNPAHYGFRLFHGTQEASTLPSGHMLLTTVLCMTLWFWYPRLRFVGVIILLLMAFSLFINLQHFICDIIAGCYLGVVIAFFVFKIFAEKFFLNKK
jgi:hypothetical protein